MVVAHVTKAIEMNHERDSGDNHKHHGRNRVEEETKTDCEVFGELKPSLVENNVLQTFAGFIDKKGSPLKK